MISSFVRALIAALKARLELALGKVALRASGDSGFNPTSAGSGFRLPSRFQTRRGPGPQVLSSLVFLDTTGTLPTLGPVANTDAKLLISGLFQKGRVLAQDGNSFPTIAVVRLKWGQVELFGSWQQTSSNGAKQVIKMQLEGISGLHRALIAQLMGRRRRVQKHKRTQDPHAADIIIGKGRCRSPTDGDQERAWQPPRVRLQRGLP